MSSIFFLLFDRDEDTEEEKSLDIYTTRNKSFCSI